MGTSVGAPRPGGAIKFTALLHISTVIIGINALSRIGSGHSVSIVCPGTEREVTQRGDPQVVTVEWHCAMATTRFMIPAKEE